MATWTAEDRDKLKAAVASGVLTVTYGGSGTPTRTVTYQSLPAMRALLAEMNAELNNAAGTRSNYKLIATRKGL
jgi:hypothetical protein